MKSLNSKQLTPSFKYFIRGLKRESERVRKTVRKKAGQRQNERMGERGRQKVSGRQ